MDAKKDDLGWEASVVQRLAALRAIPERQPQAAAQGKAAFLLEARQLTLEVRAREAPGSGYSIASVVTWWQRLFASSRTLSRRPIPAAVILILLLVALLGGFSATAYAAQSSLPTQTLYPLKLFTEDFRLSLAPALQSRITLNLRFSEQRVAEVGTVVRTGQNLPEGVISRWEKEIHIAFLEASRLNSEEFQPAMQQIRVSLERQELMLVELQERNTPGAYPQLAQLEQNIRAGLRLVATGIVDPAAFREQIQYPHQGGQRQQNGLSTPDTGSGISVPPETISAPGATRSGSSPTPIPGVPTKGTHMDGKFDSNDNLTASEEPKMGGYPAGPSSTERGTQNMQTSPTGSASGGGYSDETGQGTASPGLQQRKTEEKPPGQNHQATTDPGGAGSGGQPGGSGQGEVEGPTETPQPQLRMHGATPTSPNGSKWGDS